MILGLPVGRSSSCLQIGCVAALSANASEGRSVDRSVGWLVGRPVGRSVCQLVDRLIDRSVIRTVGPSGRWQDVVLGGRTAGGMVRVGVNMLCIV